MEEEKIIEKLPENLQEGPLIHDEQKLDPRKYTLFRLDGHTFSKFVRKFKMNLPFDSNFTATMKNTAAQCIDYFNAFIGFVGSDEITYALKPLT
jgi:tRNA(His) 5'-end guanylyltransferase